MSGYKTKYIIIPVFIAISACILAGCKKTAIEEEEPKPDLQYSFPPSVAEVEPGTYATEEIDRMAAELGLQKIYEGKYYKNDFGLVYIPEQVPTLYQHKERYRQQMEEYWKK